NRAIGRYSAARNGAHYLPDRLQRRVVYSAWRPRACPAQRPKERRKGFPVNASHPAKISQATCSVKPPLSVELTLSPAQISALHGGAGGKDCHYSNRSNDKREWLAS